MNQVKIQSITDAGVANKERIILTVLSSDNIGSYLVFSTKELEVGRISALPSNVYWFPDQEVRVGDLVVLYTGKGTPSQLINKDGTTSYFYHWGLDRTILNNNADSVALLKISQWEYKRRG